MAVVKVDELAAVVCSVAAYGRQISAVFHNYSLIAKSIPRDFLVVTNLLDASVATTRQLHTLLTPNEELQKPHLFSNEGLKYVHLLVLEIATVLTKIEPALEEAALTRQEHKKLQKQKRNAGTKTVDTVLDPLKLRIDEKAFLEKAETTKWDVAIDDLSDYIPRLYELQLRVLLVFQVGTVAKLSKDVSSGKVDVQSIVSCNKRVLRTASLVGIKVPSKRSKGFNRYGIRRSSFTDYDSTGSETDLSDSSFSSLDHRHRRTDRSLKITSGPPPPPPPARLDAPPTPALARVEKGTSPLPPPAPASATTTPLDANEIAKPPAYSEDSKVSTSTPTFLSSMPKEKQDLKEKISQQEIQVEKETLIQPETPQAQIFGAKFNTLSYRFKSLFRSKESLAEDMRRSFSNSESQLTAFVCQKRLIKPVPHSAFHSLEFTHLKTILAHNTWYEVYKTLDSLERSTLHQLLHPLPETRERELISLKVLQENKANAWLHLCADLLRSPSAGPRPSFSVSSGRLILVICKERLVDGKPIQDKTGLLAPIPLPPGHLPYPRPFGAISPPPFNPNTRDMKHPHIAGASSVLYSTQVSDLSCPPPTLSQPSEPCLPNSFGPLPPQPTPHPPTASVRYSDTTPPPNDNDCKKVLTSFREFTVHLCDQVTPDNPRNWNRVTISQESSDRNLIEEHVKQYKFTGNNVIEIKLRLTEPQSDQVTRIMDDIRRNESDPRFEWCWVEISLYDDNGISIQLTRYTLHSLVGVPSDPSQAGRLYLVAQRTLKPQYRPHEVYRSLLRGEPVPRHVWGPRPAPGAALPSPPPLRTGPGQPPTHGGPLFPILPKKSKKYSSHHSESDTCYSSDSNNGGVRRRMKRIKARKPTSKTNHYSSDSETTEDEMDDILNLKVDLKKGDSVVQKLMDLWTSAGNMNDKGRLL